MSKLTFRKLVELEPELAKLVGHRDYYRDVKPRLLRLVGWMREDGPEILQTSEAYEVAVEYLWYH